MKKNNVFLLAGEQSGDLHGAELIDTIKKESPNTHFHGVCGPKMRSQDINCIEKTESLSVMGFSDVILSLPRLFVLFKKIRNSILALQPETVIFIDYPDFNMLMARSLRKKGFKGKLIHYICPSVWAWRKGRIKTLVKNLDTLWTIFPFEKKYFENTTLDVRYIGNPLTKKIEPNSRPGPFLGLFPGSRHSEVTNNLPLQLAAAKKTNLPIAISIAHERLRNEIQEIASDENVTFFDPKDNYKMMKQCCAAIATSGTLTLELALHNVPTVVIYKISLFNYVVAKYLLRISLPYYCIVNIIADKTIFPEHVSYKIFVDKIYKDLQYILEHQKECIDNCTSIRKFLN